MLGGQGNDAPQAAVSAWFVESLTLMFASMGTMRIAVWLLTVWIVLLPSFAQDQAVTDPPDRAAFKLAVLRNDARERVDALRKFLKDYPKSGRVDAANELLLKT